MATTSKVEIGQEVAKQMLVEGAVLIILDVPLGTEFGIDLKSWNTGEKFKGVKMIPPGLHFVFYSPVNEYGDAAPRTGFFYFFEKTECLVRKWDPNTESLSNEVLAPEVVSRYKKNLLNLDKFLGAYPLDIWKTWKTLTGKISEKLVIQLTPELGLIKSALELIPCEKAETGNSSSRRINRRSYTHLATLEEKENALLPKMKPFPGTELRFTPIPEQHFPPGASPSEITLHSLDSSYVLEKMLSCCERPSDLLGEMQFSFVCFLVGQSLEAFEHWMQLVGIVCRADAALVHHTPFFSEFMSILELQLVSSCGDDSVPGDLLADVVTGKNAIYAALRALFQNIREGDNVDARLQARALHLKEQLTNGMGWEFGPEEAEEDEVELGEYAPVIVELPG
ncbi:protein AAR2 homolog [Hetaerina americana]|uniref:protein AAR2 homolog n=1 Tax=Hetaerina americana TaxID=62018 RepID=UPI003A7F2340